MIDALCGGKAVTVDLVKYRIDHPDTSGVQAAKPVGLTLQPMVDVYSTYDPSTPSISQQQMIPIAWGRRPQPVWVRADRADATIEDVALELFGGTEHAYRLAAAPPLFTFDIRDRGQMRWHYLQKLALDPVYTKMLDAFALEDTYSSGGWSGDQPPLVSFDYDHPRQQAAVGGDPLAGLDPAQRDSAAIASAPTVGPPRDRDAILAAMQRCGALLSAIRATANQLQTVWVPVTLNPDEALAPQQQRLEERRGRLRTASDNDVAMWDGHAKEQEGVLIGVATGLASVLDLIKQQREAVSVDDPPEFQNLGRTVREPIEAMIGQFVGAAACSDMVQLAKQRLAQATQSVDLYTLDVIDLILAEILATLRSVKLGGPWGAQAYDDEVIQKHLREEIAQIRTMMINSDPRAADALKALWARVQDIQVDTTLLANMDSLHEAWKQMDDMADRFGVWGSLDDDLRGLQGEATNFSAQWQAIYADWTPIRDQTGEAAEAAKKGVRDRIVTLTKTMSDARFFARMQKAMERAAIAAIVARVVGLLIIIVATAGVGALVEGALGVGGLALGAEVVVTVQVIAEAATFTALNTMMFETNPTLQGVVVEFIYNVALFGAMRKVSAMLEASKLGKFLGESSKAALEFGKHTANALVLTTGTLARAEVEKILNSGRTLSRAEAEDIIVSTLVSYVALAIFTRTTEPLMEKLKGVGGRIATAITEANALRVQVNGLAAGLQKSRDLAQLRELIAMDAKSLDKDIAALDEVARAMAEEPDVLFKAMEKAGMTPDEIAALAETLPANLRNLKIAQLMARAKPMGGEMYKVPREQLLDNLARHKQMGATVTPKPGSQPGDLPSFEVQYPDGTKLDIYEEPPEPTGGTGVADTTAPDPGRGAAGAGGGPAPTEPPPTIGTIDTSRLSATQQAATRWQTHGLETDPRAAELMKDPDFRQWYARWAEMPNRLEPQGDGFKINYPEGAPQKARDQIKAVVEGGGITLATRALEVTEALGREFPELTSVDPTSSQWQQARPRLVQRFGAPAVARYEATLAGRPGDPGREALDLRVKDVLADGALDAFRGAFPDYEIYLTGSITQPTGAGGKVKPIESVKDVDVILVPKQSMTVDQRIATEKRAGSMRMPTSPTYRAAVQRATGKPAPETLEIDVKVMTPDEHAGWVMMEPAKGRTPMTDLRVDEAPRPQGAGPGGTPGAPGGGAPGGGFSGTDLHNHVMGVPGTGYFINKVGNGRSVELLNRSYEMAKGSKKFQGDAPDLWERLQAAKAKVDKMKAEGKRPDEVEQAAFEAMDGMLSTTKDNPFYKTYDVRDLLIEGSIDPQRAGEAPGPYRNYAKDTVRMLAEEGVGYSEQSVSIKKLQQRFDEKTMDQVHDDLAKEGKDSDMRFLAMLKTQALAKGDVRTQGGEGKPDPDAIQKEYDSNLDQLYDRKTGKGVLMRGDVRGIDFAGPEAGSFTGEGMKNFRSAYSRVQMAARARNVVLEVRPHVGEGDASTDPAHADHARENLQTLLEAIKGLKDAGLYTGNPKVDGVDIRFGHATHATEAQIKLMGELGITVEANMSSNLRTGSIVDAGDHPLLYNLYYNVKTVLATDAQGVMGTTLPAEYAGAQLQIADFVAGNSAIVIEGKPTKYADITDQATRDRFDIKQLTSWADAYRAGVEQGDAGDLSRQFGSDGSKLELGKKIGSGGEKDVYAVKGRDDVVAGVAKADVTAERMQDEAGKLRQLRELGLPVVEVEGIINHNGRPTMIMKGYAQGSKSVVKTVRVKGRGKVSIVGESEYLNERSISDLEGIRDLMEQTPVKIDDLQFLIGEDGEIVIADPVDVKVGEKPSDNNRNTIKKLIEAAQAAIKKRSK
ncbi:MAG TPA: hypothetical protein VL172_00975 [Kofleriaceae bacterium]|nr:hypothetical protein [Kofleriaceae bacterium]